NPKSLSDHLRRDAPALRQSGIAVSTGLHKWLDGVSKRVIEIASLPLPAPDNHPEKAAANRHFDEESLTQDAALTHEFLGLSQLQSSFCGQFKWLKLIRRRAATNNPPIVYTAELQVSLALQLSAEAHALVRKSRVFSLRQGITCWKIGSCVILDALDA